MYTIVVADDEEELRRAIIRKIDWESIGFRVVGEAENGIEALELVERMEPDLLLTDIRMPFVSGIELARQVREVRPTTQIAFLSGFDEFSYAKKAISVRAIDYVLKPYDENELMLVIEEAMRMVEEQGQRKEMEQFFQNESEEADFEEDPVQPEDDNDHMSRVGAMIRSFIEENYMYDISMQELARRMNYSEPYFCKLFKQYFDQNFTAYLTEYRIAEAKKLLEQPTFNIKDVGKAVGYSDSNYFTKVFKRITGQSPTEYRNG